MFVSSDRGENSLFRLNESRLARVLCSPCSWLQSLMDRTARLWALSITRQVWLCEPVNLWFGSDADDVVAAG
eukprot:m.319166 g.319166  ORF g.319166 m.319166 type:complete len:72 (-) comp55490_c0_seq31:399-614(-)